MIHTRTRTRTRTKEEQSRAEQYHNGTCERIRCQYRCHRSSDKRIYGDEFLATDCDRAVAQGWPSQDRYPSAQIQCRGQHCNRRQG